jgi:hypothetical protein
VCKNAEKWLFRLSEDYLWDSGLPIQETVVFVDKTETPRLKLVKGGQIHIFSGYAWDGCTPKSCLLDIVFGIPDGVIDSRTGRPKTFYASLVHDALYQFLSEGSPVSRSVADKCFLRLMSDTGFVFRYPYFIAVRIFGGMFRRAMKIKRKTAGRMIREASME